MTGSLDLRLANDLAEIPRLAETVEGFFDEHGLPPKLAFAFNLALDELLTNVISYAFAPGTTHEIAVRLAVADGQVTAELEDDGPAFDPLTDARAPVLDGDIDDRPIGGLGIHFVKTMMDRVDYERRDGRNRLTMSKRADA
ncbi:MAG TPA: ATP-binding protein [Azospirillum sp.]